MSAEEFEKHIRERWGETMRRLGQGWTIHHQEMQTRVGAALRAALEQPSMDSGEELLAALREAQGLPWTWGPRPLVLCGYRIEAVVEGVRLRMAWSDNADVGYVAMSAGVATSLFDSTCWTAYRDQWPGDEEAGLQLWQACEDALRAMRPDHPARRGTDPWRAKMGDPMTLFRLWRHPIAGVCKEWKRGGFTALLVEGSQVTYTYALSPYVHYGRVDFAGKIALPVPDYACGTEDDDADERRLREERAARDAAHEVAMARGGEAQDLAWTALVARWDAL